MIRDKGAVVAVVVVVVGSPSLTLEFLLLPRLELHTLVVYWRDIKNVNHPSILQYSTALLGRNPGKQACPV